MTNLSSLLLPLPVQTRLKDRMPTRTTSYAECLEQARVEMSAFKICSEKLDTHLCTPQITVQPSSAAFIPSAHSPQFVAFRIDQLHLPLVGRGAGVDWCWKTRPLWNVLDHDSPSYFSSVSKATHSPRREQSAVRCCAMRVLWRGPMMGCIRG